MGSESRFREGKRIQREQAAKRRRDRKITKIAQDRPRELIGRKIKMNGGEGRIRDYSAKQCKWLAVGDGIAMIPLSDLPSSLCKFELPTVDTKLFRQLTKGMFEKTATVDPD